MEYEVPEAAAQAIKKRNGATLGGRSLKVNRPSNYNATLPNGGLPAPYPERVYVANVHEGVSEKDLREVFEAFGAVKACVLVPDPIQQKHKVSQFLHSFFSSVPQFYLIAVHFAPPSFLTTGIWLYRVRARCLSRSSLLGHGRF